MSSFAKRMSEEEFSKALNEVLGGSSYKELSTKYPYKVPYLSTKIRDTAKKLGKEDLLDIALKKQKTVRNNGKCTNLPQEYERKAVLATTCWKEHPVYPFLISDGGLVKSIKSQKILRASITEVNTNKYARVILSYLGNRIVKQIHRLVLETFNNIENTSYFQVDHLDNNGLNNSLYNLEWVSGSDNINRSFQRNLKTKLNICSLGGISATKVNQEKAEVKYRKMLGDRLLSINIEPGQDSTITWKCKTCLNTFTTDFTNKSIRYGRDGICPPCRKINKKHEYTI